MARGFLAGGFWGLVVSGLGLTTASLLAEQPAGNDPPEQPQIESPEIAGGGEATDVDGVVPDVTADAGGAPAPSDTPEVGLLDDGTGSQVTDTDPADQPEGGEITTALAAPEIGVQDIVVSGTEEPVSSSTETSVPAEPAAEADVSLDTTTPEPPAAEAVVEEELAEPVDEEVAPEGDAASVEEELAEPTEEAEAEAEAEVAEADPADVDVAEEPAVELAEVVEEAEDDAGISEAPVLVAPEVDGTLPTTPDTDEDGGPRIALQGDGATLPGDGAVRIIAEDEAVAEDVAVTEAAPSEVETSAVSGALESFAASSEVSGDKPLMSVILIDDGSLPGSGAALAELGFPVTIALDPAVAGAAETMAEYRAAGIEIIALAEVPAGAQVVDAEVTLEAGFAALDEAIGLLDIGQAGLQRNPELSAVAMARLADDGRGFVTLSSGLNGGLRAADEADVPAVAVYRDLDGEDQDARVIRRFLDQSAFRARQQGSVVLVGRVRPDTITALTQWSAANQEGQVELAPVSAVLLEGQE